LRHTVGIKGQIVIKKEIREQLGIQPGWLGIQSVVDDHLEIHFLPPEHDESLKGRLARYVRRRIPPGEEWEQAREQAWVAAAREKLGPDADAP
jgi:AbrB family looped-hinge helix DNA binding protein